MGIETFPEIENFQHLPRQVIVKGGSSIYDEREGAILQGIVINNIGQTIRNLRVNLVIFNEKKIPLMSASTTPHPDTVQQGGISTFSFQVKDYPREIRDYHLYTDWNFHDKT